MAEKDITQIKVGKFAVSIIGIKPLMDEMAGTHADKADDEIRFFMLDRLGQSNYIPAGAEADYGQAFVREFRKFLGQPYTEDAPQGLDIKVLGTGCPQCHALTQMVMEVLTEINLPAGVDHVTDIKEIARYGIMGSPALLINGKAVAVGNVPSRDRVKKWLVEAGQFSGGKR
ncbi:MAG: thioredoxin family protein [Syntrophobacteraceae bacterium]|jgi:small redox-active disulfide protein 2